VQLRSGVVRLIHAGWQPDFFLVARARLGRWGGQLVVPGKFVVVVSPVVSLECPKERAARFAQTEGCQVIGEYVEIETGKDSDALERRPQLSAAINTRSCSPP
jgi:hypothetical protein